MQCVGKAQGGCWYGNNISQKPPDNVPTPPSSVYIVFLCIWVKDVQYMSSLCSRFYIYNMNPVLSPSSPHLRRMPACAVIGFGTPLEVGGGSRAAGFYPGMFWQCWLCPRCDRNISGLGRDGSSQQEQRRAHWRHRVCRAGSASPGPAGQGCAGAALLEEQPWLQEEQSWVQECLAQQPGQLPVLSPASLWPSLPRLLWVLLSSWGCFIFHSLPWAEPLCCALAWIGEGMRRRVWATLGHSCWATRAFLAGLEAPSPSTFPFCSHCGESSSTEAGAKHVTGRTVLPIKLQTVSQEIPFLRCSCFSQAFGLYVLCVFVVFL